jgi:hypothetical protein
VTHTQTELSQAVTSMFRVRAVESPPDPSGERTIWHRGAKGADLVTWVDPLGKVTRQELYLFEDCVIWEKGVGLRTGQHQEALGSKLNPAPGMIAFDPNQDGDRLQRARAGLSAYTGNDKCIIHARQLVNQATRGTPDAIDEPVTAPGRPDQPKAEPPPVTAASRRPLLIAVVVLGAALATVGAWLIFR